MSRDWEERPDLVGERLGGAALYCNDEFFAPKENLVRPEAPIFDPDRYTERGKWMDGWETRRRREPGHDWCILRLGTPGTLEGVVIDTRHFKGNYPEAARLSGCYLEGAPDRAALEAAPWHEILPKTPLEGDTQNRFDVTCPYGFTHVRLEIFPDGGVARLRAYGRPLPGVPAGRTNLAAVECGALVEEASDMFFSSRHNLLLPGPPTHMGDGWETRRRRGPGNDWVVVRLAAPGRVEEIVVDTTHFKGNAPGACALSGRREAGPWQPLLERTALQPHTVHRFADLAEHDLVDTVRLDIYPDGGVARLRILGTVPDPLRRGLGVERLDRLPPEAAEAAFLQCCGSRRWAEAMAARRPFGTEEALLTTAEAIWRDLEVEDWLEAFAAHPRIGERRAAQTTGETAARWSRQEQAGTVAAAPAVLEALAEMNRRYEEKFGFVFLIFATGKRAEEMLDAARERLEHDRETELRIAAAEQMKITKRRLEKWLDR